MKKLNLVFKVTNWCDLNCKNCPEHSNSDNKKDFLPVSTIRKYIAQFQDLKANKSDEIIFIGGEPIMPYEIVRNCYLPSCMDIVYHYGFTPVFRTNGMWGKDENPLGRIQTMMDVATQYGAKMVLNLPVHSQAKNRAIVGGIVKNILHNKKIKENVRVTITDSEPVGAVLRINNDSTAQLNGGQKVALGNKDLQTLLAELHQLQFTR